MKENVVIIGASNNHQRYSYQALRLLADNGHRPIPVNPKLSEIEGHVCYSGLQEVIKEVKVNGNKRLHTLTIYINSHLSSTMEEEIVNFPVDRVIFNPGTENPSLINKLRLKGIKVEEACTLVLLRTNQFE